MSCERAGRSGGEGVKAGMTRLASPSGPGATFIIVSGRNEVELSLAAVPGPRTWPGAGPVAVLFRRRRTWPELARGNFARPPGPRSPRRWPGSRFSPSEARSEGSDWTPATLVAVRVRCSPPGRISPAFVGGWRTACCNFQNFYLWRKRVGCTQQFCSVAQPWQTLGKSTNSFVTCPAASQPPSPCAASFAYFNSNSLNSADKS